MKNLLSIKGAKETLSNYKASKKAIKGAKDNVNTLSINKAKRKYTERTGREMTPSILRGEMDGIISKDTRQYLKDKKNIKKDYYSRFGL